MSYLSIKDSKCSRLYLSLLIMTRNRVTDTAMLKLTAAENSLKTLKKVDLSEVHVLKRPPLVVHLVMEAICIVVDVKPNKGSCVKINFAIAYFLACSKKSEKYYFPP
jgi:hypothetical protein